jgi:hypothetical protein
MRNRLGMLEQVVPLLAPVDAAATEKKVFVKLSNAHRCQFLLYFGVITATSADQNITVTVLACTSAATTGGTALAFNYRVSAATGTDTFGAVVAATTAGISVDTTAADGMLYIIDVDPKAFPAVAEDAIYACLDIVPDAGGTVTLCSVIGLLEPRFAGTTMLSST